MFVRLSRPRRLQAIDDQEDGVFGSKKKSAAGKRNPAAVNAHPERLRSRADSGALRLASSPAGRLAWSTARQRRRCALLPDGADSWRAPSPGSTADRVGLGLGLGLGLGCRAGRQAGVRYRCQDQSRDQASKALVHDDLLFSKARYGFGARRVVGTALEKCWLWAGCGTIARAWRPPGSGGRHKMFVRSRSDGVSIRAVPLRFRPPRVMERRSGYPSDAQEPRAPSPLSAQSGAPADARGNRRESLAGRRCHRRCAPVSGGRAAQGLRRRRRGLHPDHPARRLPVGSRS